MKKQIVPLIMLSVVLSACNQKTQTSDPNSTNERVKTEAKNVLQRMPTLHVEDTVKSGNNVYTLIINREACDSLGVVVDDMGYRYSDNLLNISVKKNGSLLFARTFKKADFLNQLDAEFAKHSILDGCRYLQVHEGMVTFSLAVSYPDSDMSRPFKLNIGPDGSYMIIKNDDLEEEYNPDSLSGDGV